jgi:hypothetical protein
VPVRRSGVQQQGSMIAVVSVLICHGRGAEQIFLDTVPFQSP